MQPIIGLVGPSGSGKTTLIKEMLKRFPKKLAALKSLTTRPRRDADDKLFYDFISEKDMREKDRNNELIQISEYAGNLYGNDLMKTTELLQNKAGICALVEQGVKNFQEAGFNVIIVKILPEGGRISEDEARRSADTTRAQENLEADFEIVNSFSPGGLGRAMDDLAGVIEMAV